MAKIQNVLDDSGATKFGENYLVKEALALINFTKGSAMPEGGFGYLDSFGNPTRIENFTFNVE